MSANHDRFCATPIVLRALELASRPEGLQSIELSQEFPKNDKAYKTVAKLVRFGKLFQARLGWRNHIVFATPEAAARCEEMHRLDSSSVRPKTPAMYAKSPTPNRGLLSSAAKAPRAQCHWNPKARPGDADYVAPTLPLDDAGQPLYKLTVAPTPPSPCRTNTFSGMA